MSKDIHNDSVNMLFRAILALETIDECYTFFEDACTVNELKAIAQRFEVARMLKDNQTYMKISKATGASTATISRVKRSLDYGQDGYDLVLARMNIEENE